MKNFLPLILLLSVLKLNAQIDTSGIEIYEVKTTYKQISKKQKDSCHYCIDTSIIKLSKQPLIKQKDILSFDWKNQKITLTKEAKTRINQITIPIQGKPMALTLNGEIIYTFWFWNSVSSQGCDRVYTFPKMDFSLKFGLPSSFTFGTDPRFNNKLKQFLKSKN